MRTVAKISACLAFLLAAFGGSLQAQEHVATDGERAQDAVDQLEGKELARLASLAQDAEDQLAGGDTTFTITATTIIIALLVAILLIVV